ncbi:autotransporter assembly complex protein TamA [Pseudoalteromonas tunicata]|uniref:Translocation and assembly module subunit TamA n=1 Tax=Pseudoalteromonas tunicata D2 TaxID=87626 RepID=A4C5K4_9GAMM|nr:autotransporter assembly complex family protein [Pseudoalteromonas tunicata]ATC95232.1 outer membrane protein [Pseudoalteromonas tunicata]EAR29258.1 hypothetical protein PTD2_10599 [Pseudoalteromonas tunicata D2]MDP4982350.1 autotransporter assembly complex protein TamA [Pseudoalteromonas tunicata]
MLLLRWLLVCLFCGSVFAASEPINKIVIKGVDSALEDNVRSYLADTLDAEPSAYLKTRIEQQAAQALKALGYYQPNITTQFISNKNNTQLELTIEPNEPTRIAKLDVQIIGEGAADPELQVVLTSLPIAQGEVLNHNHYSSAKSKIESLLMDLGYFDAKWQQSQLAVTLANNSAEVTLLLDSGVRYVFGPVQVQSDTPAGEYIRSLQPFEMGEPFKAGRLSDFNLNLSNTPYFNSVRVHADVVHRQQGQVPVIVEVLHKPANSYEVGGGFSTDLGAKVRFKWTKPWYGKEGHYMDSDIEASEMQQELRFSYTVPVDNPIDDVWRFVAGYKHEENSDIDKYSRKITTQAQRQWLTSHKWIRTAFLKYEREDYHLGDQDDTTQMLLPGISYARKQAKGGMTPYWGQSWNVSAEFASQKFVSSTDIFKVRVQTAWLRTLDTRHLFFMRATLGAILVDDISSVPLSMRFFAGGDQSIRGFKYEAISPLEAGERVGGRYLTTGTLEYNYQFSEQWRAALFVDGGTATNDFSEALSVGAGIGLRWLTPVGPIRFDTAWALSDPQHPARLSITIGPEL